MKNTAYLGDRLSTVFFDLSAATGLRQSRLRLEVNSEHSDLTEFRNHPGGKCEVTGCSKTIYFWQHGFFPSYPSDLPVLLALDHVNRGLYWH